MAIAAGLFVLPSTRRSSADASRTPFSRVHNGSKPCIRNFVSTIPAVKWRSLVPHNPRVSSTARRAVLFPRAEISVVAGTELDAISKFSEIVPDTVIFDDFERFPPTAATVSPSVLLGITGLPRARYNSAIERALAYGKCYTIQSTPDRLSCFLSKALVNVGADLVKLVPGRVSTEVDARLSYDTPGIIEKVQELLSLYDEVEVARERLLFKISGTWQLHASRSSSSSWSFCHSSDWARNHSGDKDVDAALQMGQDPGVALAMKTYNYIHRYGYKSKVMAAAIRNKQDVFSLLGLDYLIVPVKILQFLKESKADLGEKYAFEPRLTKSAARAIEFSDYETKRWDQARFAENLGPLGEQMLRASLLGNVEQTTRIEQYFAKIWPPPNV